MKNDKDILSQTQYERQRPAREAEKLASMITVGTLVVIIVFSIFWYLS